MHLLLNLQQRLFLPYALILIITSGTIWWGTLWMFSNVLERRLETQLQHASIVLTDFGLPFTKNLIDQIHRLQRADIVLITQDNTVGISSLDLDSHQVADTVLQQYLKWHSKKSKINESIIFQNADQSYKLVFRLIPPKRDNRYTAVAIFSSLSDIELAKQQATLWVGSLIIFSLLFLAWMGHRTTMSITHPIHRLTNMAKRIAAGERKMQVNVRKNDKNDEIGILSDSLNKMSRELSIFEQQLADKGRLEALGQMTAQVAHEIRNPLTAIKLQLQLLNETVEGEPQTTTQLLLDEIQRLEFILSGLLEWGSSIRLNKSKVDFNQLITETIHILNAQIKHRNINLQTSLAADLPTPIVDGNRIKQVVFNLLINACDALPNGGVIQLKTSYKNGQIIIIVEDSGSGITDEIKPFLFTKLSTTKTNGFGLGLPLSKNLIDLHNGHIKVESSHLGGARFTVNLPYTENHV